MAVETSRYAPLYLHNLKDQMGGGRKDAELTKSMLTLAARFINPARARMRVELEAHLLTLGTVPSGVISPKLPGTWVVMSALLPEANSPVPVGSTMAVYGPAPSVVTICRVPLRLPPLLLT